MGVTLFRETTMYQLACGRRTMPLKCCRTMPLQCFSVRTFGVLIGFSRYRMGPEGFMNRLEGLQGLGVLWVCSRGSAKVVGTF